MLEFLWKYGESLTSFKASLDRPPEALENGRFCNFFGCPAIGYPERNSCPIFLKLSQKLLCNVFQLLWKYGEDSTTWRVFFFRRPETSRNSLFAREFSALFECCSANSSSSSIPLALRARSDRLFTLLIKFCSFSFAFKKRPAWEVPNMAVFQSLATAHYGGAFYAVFRENSTDLPETCTNCHLWCKNGDAALGSLLFICIQKKVQRDRCQTGLSFSHWQPLIKWVLGPLVTGCDCDLWRDCGCWLPFAEILFFKTY